jgi:hypothetical protein
MLSLTIYGIIRYFQKRNFFALPLDSFFEELSCRAFRMKRSSD